MIVSLYKGLIQLLYTDNSEHVEEVAESNGHNLQASGYDVALKIVTYYEGLPQNEQENLLWRQLLKYGLAIGASLQTISPEYSRKELLARLRLSRKELREIVFLLRVLRDTSHLTAVDAEGLFSACENLSNALIQTAKKIKQFSI